MTSRSHHAYAPGARRGGANRAYRRLAAFAIVTCAITSGACSLLDDFGGLSSGFVDTEAGSPDDGATPGSDATTETPEVVPIVDAGCDTTFCDDFDTATFAERWSMQSLTLNGTSVSRVDAGRSPPFALRAAVPELASGEHRRALLVKPFNAPGGLDCTFYLRGSFDNPSTVYILRVTSAEFATYELAITLYPNDAGANVAMVSTRTFDGGIDAGYSFGGTGTIPISDWSQLTVRAAFGDGGARRPVFDVLIGEGPAAREIATTASSVERIELLVGADSFGRAAGEVLIDDVRCTALE